MKPGETGIKRIINAGGYSIKGLQFAWKNEAAFRQEIVLTLVLVPLAFWLGETAVERALLLMTLGLVVITELVNTAIEAVVDRVGSELHALAGAAKDVGSATVLVSIALMLLIWGLFLFEKFM